jgi:hypothetical protein
MLHGVLSTVDSSTYAYATYRFFADDRRASKAVTHRRSRLGVGRRRI